MREGHHESSTHVDVPAHVTVTAELFGHTPSSGHSEFNITGVAVPPHGCRMFVVSAAPSRWIPNQGTAAASIVLNSSGCV